jgi:hypothetical protein
MEYKLFEIYSHKYAEYVVAKEVNDIESIVKYNKKHDVIREINLRDFIIFHSEDSECKYVSVVEYLMNNRHLHKVGYCFMESFQYVSGTVEIVPENKVKNGEKIYYLEWLEVEE